MVRIPAKMPPRRYRGPCGLCHRLAKVAATLPPTIALVSAIVRALLGRFEEPLPATMELETALEAVISGQTLGRRIKAARR